jgi:hypothetical protein
MKEVIKLRDAIKEEFPDTPIALDLPLFENGAIYRSYSSYVLV